MFVTTMDGIRQPFYLLFYFEENSEITDVVMKSRSI